MKILDSTITMASKRNYNQSDKKGQTQIQNDFLSTYENFSGQKISDPTTNQVKEIGENSTDNLPMSFTDSSLAALMNRLLQHDALSPFGNSTPSYSEYECTSFHADGIVHTEDGREIDFNINLTMTRSYAEYMNADFASLKNALIDPLIVNFEGGIAGISDQKFLFDIDADGKVDEISSLRSGSGFLALDKNEDGIINDGSELFGTSSGNGFNDLQVFDGDGNGWIDENDEIFSKLKIWAKQEDGTDRLIDLKESGIGAIFLGYADTQFDIYNDFNGPDGVIKNTGFFLREDGGAGLVQQVDLAKNKEMTSGDFGFSPVNLMDNSNKQINFYYDYSFVQTIENQEGTLNRIDSHIDNTKAINRIQKANEEYRDLLEQAQKRREIKRQILEENYARRKKHRDMLEEIYQDSIKRQDEYKESLEEI